MVDEIVYMLGLIGVGFLVNYTLRALPFILFSGRDRTLPGWVEKLGGVISPIIIAGLIVYAYSGSAWRTPWPYLAGVVTVGLQIWKRNPLMSIVVGTVLYMCLLNCGCTHARVATDAQQPAILVTTTGVEFEGEKINPLEIPERLDDCEVPKTRTIHIRLAPDVKDLSLAKALMALLARSGYTRPMLVTERHAESLATGRKKPAYSAAPKAKPTKIRYKKAGE